MIFQKYLLIYLLLIWFKDGVLTNTVIAVWTANAAVLTAISWIIRHVINYVNNDKIQGYSILKTNNSEGKGDSEPLIKPGEKGDVMLTHLHTLPEENEPEKGDILTQSGKVQSEFVVWNRSSNNIASSSSSTSLVKTKKLRHKRKEKEFPKTLFNAWHFSKWLWAAGGTCFFGLASETPELKAGIHHRTLRYSARRKQASALSSVMAAEE